MPLEEALESTLEPTLAVDNEVSTDSIETEPLTVAYLPKEHDVLEGAVNDAPASLEKQPISAEASGDSSTVPATTGESSEEPAGDTGGNQQEPEENVLGETVGKSLESQAEPSTPEPPEKDLHSQTEESTVMPQVESLSPPTLVVASLPEEVPSATETATEPVESDQLVFVDALESQEDGTLPTAESKDGVDLTQSPMMAAQDREQPEDTRSGDASAHHLELGVGAAALAAAAGIAVGTLALGQKDNSPKDSVVVDPTVAPVTADKTVNIESLREVPSQCSPLPNGPSSAEQRDVPDKPNDKAVDVVQTSQATAVHDVIVHDASVSAPLDAPSVLADLESKAQLGSLSPLSTEDSELRASTPAVVLPDEEMVGLQRQRTLRRMQKRAVREAEDTVAAAVVIYATAEALSPPESPRLGSSEVEGGSEVPVTVQQDVLEPPATEAQDDVPRGRRLHGPETELRKSVTDLFTEARSRELGPSSSDPDRERHRKHRHSQHSSANSSRSRGEDGDKEGRQRSSHSSRHRSNGARSSADKTPPRTPRRQDSGYSGESSGSSGKRRRTAEEQADHERRKAERALKGKEAERRQTPSRDRKSKEAESPVDRSNRSSRRQSYSSNTRSDSARISATVEREQSIVQPEKRFFDVKNAVGIVGHGPPTPPIIRDTVIPPSSSKEAPPRADAPTGSSSTRSRRSSRRQSTDQARPKTPKSQEEHASEEQKSPKSSSSKTSPKASQSSGGEDAARRARRSERNKAADGSKKSSGLRSLVKRLFTSS